MFTFDTRYTRDLYLLASDFMCLFQTAGHVFLLVSYLGRSPEINLTMTGGNTAGCLHNQLCLLV